MPIDAKIYVEKNLIFHTATGEVTGSDIREAVEARVGASEYSPGMDVLWDFREGQLAATPQDVTYLGAVTIKKMPHSQDQAKLAVVAPKSATHGMMREFKGWWSSQPRRFEVFWTMEETLDWLGSDDCELGD